MIKSNFYDYIQIQSIQLRSPAVLLKMEDNGLKPNPSSSRSWPHHTHDLNAEAVTTLAGNNKMHNGGIEEENPPLLVGERIMWTGERGTLPKKARCGIVKWIGRLQEFGNIWTAGVQFVSEKEKFYYL